MLSQMHSCEKSAHFTIADTPWGLWVGKMVVLSPPCWHAHVPTILTIPASAGTMVAWAPAGTVHAPPTPVTHTGVVVEGGVVVVDGSAVGVAASGVVPMAVGPVTGPAVVMMIEAVLVTGEPETRVHKPFQAVSLTGAAAGRSGWLVVMVGAVRVPLLRRGRGGRVEVVAPITSSVAVIPLPAALRRRATVITAVVAASVDVAASRGSRYHEEDHE